ncbi:MAG: phospholipid carrier-dependent glycosyltransferase [Fulvivirga sp.]|uniref:ArnT family glycosyltransferase n=1 Tax=Fulvivirga sp. TaxID=1931237 RepID=UPI0032EE5F15
MENTQLTGEKYKWTFIGILALTFVIAYSLTFDSKLALLGDNASYYSLGKAIAQGEGYVNISRVTKSPNNHYPPGYPAIISAVLVFSDSVVGVKLLNGLFLMGSIWLAFLLTARLTDNYITAFVVSLLTVLNSHALFYGSLMMSEVPYMFFSLLALHFITKKQLSQLSIKNKTFILTIIFMVISYYVRSLGVAILGGLGLYFLLNKNWKLLFASIGGLIIGGLPWFIRGQSLGGTSYMNQLKMINPYNPSLGEAGVSDFIERFWSNFSRYITREIPDVLLNFGPNYSQPIEFKEWVLGLILLSIITYGVVKINQYNWLLLGYLLGTFGILMIWPDVWIGVRFIVPIIPILWLGFLNGFFELFKLIRGQKEISAVTNYAPLVILLFLFTPLKELSVKAKAPFPPAWEQYFAVADWIKKNEKQAVVSCGKPSLFFIYAGENYTMRYKFSNDPADLIEDLEKKQVDYVVIDQVYGNTFQYLLPAVRQYPNRFKQVLHLKNPDTFLLKFER